MTATARRLLPYLLVPLSALPIVAAVPLVRPSVEHRVEQLRDAPPPAPASPAPAVRTSRTDAPATHDATHLSARPPRSTTTATARRSPHR